jgi:pimeloyl-[acyl-carrier protein] methyl ester esterase
MKDIVLLHGWGMSATVFDVLQRELASRVHAVGLSDSPLRVGISSGLRTHAVDLPGYRGRATAETHTLDTLARAIADSAPPRCAVLGWSLGALIALAWAAQAPGQVESLIIVAGTPCFVRRTDWPHGVGVAVFSAFAEELRVDRDRTLRRFAGLQARGDESSKDVLRALGAASADGVRDDVLLQGLRILRETDLRPVLNVITQRTLLLHGARDELVPIAAAEYLETSLPAAELEAIAGAAHAPFLSQPARVARRIRVFLDE